MGAPLLAVRQQSSRTRAQSLSEEGFRINGPGWRIAEALWNEGYWLRPLHNSLYLVPPYCATVDDLRGLFGVLYSAVSEESFYG